jgi:hypothetical protein
MRAGPQVSLEMRPGRSGVAVSGKTEPAVQFAADRDVGHREVFAEHVGARRQVRLEHGHQSLSRLRRTQRGRGIATFGRRPQPLHEGLAARRVDWQQTTLYEPDAAPQVTIEQWIPAVYLPVTTPVTGFNAGTELLDTIFLQAATDNVLDTLRSRQTEVRYYRFDWDEEPAPFDDIYGAAHAFDLPFLFGNFGPSLFSNVANSSANRAGRMALSQAMMASLAAFARGGDPNAPKALGVSWPTWPSKLIFDATPVDKSISVQ